MSGWENEAWVKLKSGWANENKEDAVFCDSVECPNVKADLVQR